MRKIPVLLTGFLLLPLSLSSSMSDTELFWKKFAPAPQDLIEEIPEYSSSINWSSGKILTMVSLEQEFTSPNISTVMHHYEEAIRDELRQNLLKAMGSLRISELFLLRDYFSMKNELRTEIVAQSDRAFFYPATLARGNFYGMVELPLYGRNGLANLFYRNIEKIKVTNYIQENNPNLEYFDSLILDTTGYPQYKPSLQTRIYDQDGNLLYGPETVDSVWLEKQGVCGFTMSLERAFQSGRTGSHIYYLIPYSLKGRMNTDFVLHNKDAARLMANPRTIKFLSQGRVMVVVQPVKKK